MARRAPQMGQVATWPAESACIKVVQPLVLQYSGWPDVTRRIRRRADAPWLYEEWL